jgi:mono/diheme cytochrome c family protein
MSKRLLVIFGLFAAVCLLLLPYWAFSKEGSKESVLVPVAEEDGDAKEMFAVNCGSCHTLAAAGTDGVVGPDLDEVLGPTPDVAANRERVLSAIENGILGRMPAGILGGSQAEEVADFVARHVRYTSPPEGSALFDPSESETPTGTP